MMEHDYPEDYDVEHFRLLDLMERFEFMAKELPKQSPDKIREYSKQFHEVFDEIVEIIDPQPSLINWYSPGDRKMNFGERFDDEPTSPKTSDDPA